MCSNMATTKAKTSNNLIIEEDDDLKLDSLPKQKTTTPAIMDIDLDSIEYKLLQANQSYTPSMFEIKRTLVDNVDILKGECMRATKGI